METRKQSRTTETQKELKQLQKEVQQKKENKKTIAVSFDWTFLARLMVSEAKKNKSEEYIVLVENKGVIDSTDDQIYMVWLFKRDWLVWPVRETTMNNFLKTIRKQKNVQVIEVTGLEQMENV